MLSVRASFAALTTEFACNLAVYAALELSEQASVSLTLKAARDRNLTSALLFLLSNLAVQLARETIGKFRVLKTRN